MTHKIDIYRVRRNSAGRVIARDYLCSTNQHKRCRDAANSVRAARGLGHAELVAFFDRSARA